MLRYGNRVACSTYGLFNQTGMDLPTHKPVHQNPTLPTPTSTLLMSNQWRTPLTIPDAVKHRPDSSPRASYELETSGCYKEKTSKPSHAFKLTIGPGGTTSIPWDVDINTPPLDMLGGPIYKRYPKPGGGTICSPETDGQPRVLLYFLVAKG